MAATATPRGATATMVVGRKFPHGTYTGRLVNNSRDGGGTVTWPSGDTYAGEWKDDKWHGRGVFKKADGEAYDGEWHNYYRDGWGLWNDADGSSWYEGLWRHNRWARGTWHPNKDDGDGDNDVREGEWVWNEKKNRHDMHGWGVQREGAGSGQVLYAGEWVDGKFQGWGVRLWANGDRYEGEWLYGKENGEGERMQACDGTVVDGVWEMGAIKSGTMTWPNGDKFTGTFADDDVGQGIATVKSHDSSSTTSKFEGTVTSGVFQEHGNRGFRHHMGCGDPLMEEELRRLQTEKTIIQQKLDEQTECLDHVLKHIQQGSWVKSTFQPATNQRENNTTMKDALVTLEKPNITFQDSFCSLCPFDKIVKMEIEKRFGVAENHQVVSVVVHNPNSEETTEITLSGTSSTLSHLLLRSEPQMKVMVRIAPMMPIQERDLKISSQLGTGSYGTVFKGTLLSSRDVAVKSLHDAILSTYNIDRFRLEAERKLKFQEVTAIALGVAKGMDALHRQKYMHQDLSSNNILLDAEGTPKICDFGVSCGTTSQVISNVQQTRTHRPGTLVYMSPQMFTKHYTSKGDVWSFGVLTTEMICGKIVDSSFHKLPPAKQTMFLMEQEKSLPVPDVAEVNRLCHEATESTVAHCLSRRTACINVVKNLVHSPNSLFLSLVAPPNANLAAVIALGTAPDLLLLIVQSCLSICEINRVPFTVIMQVLHCCCTSAAIALLSSASGSGYGIMQDQVSVGITQWLSSLSPTIASISASSTRL
ncbi:hypothetical protein Pelo_5382 [Pelomyxa schiedti]|nr:hypothetical protein Pelo_5382 [Pelomyxa schiedti]